MAFIMGKILLLAPWLSFYSPPTNTSKMSPIVSKRERVTNYRHLTKTNGWMSYIQNWRKCLGDHISVKISELR